jgi:hypothetical protein
MQDSTDAQLEPNRAVPRGKMHTCHFEMQNKLYVERPSVIKFDQNVLQMESYNELDVVAFWN